MSSNELNRLAYPTALVAAGVLAFALPLVSRYCVSGRWPVAKTRTGRLSERLVEILLFICGLLFATWAMLYAILGAESLSVWPVPLWLAIRGPGEPATIDGRDRSADRSFHL